MTSRDYVWSARRKSQQCPGMSCLVRSLQAGEWLSWFHGKPTFRRRANQSWLSAICNFADIAAWSQNSLTMFTQKLTFFEKRPLTGKFSKMFSKRIHHLSDPRLVCKFSEIWLTGNRYSHALFMWQKTQNFGSLPTLASAQITPKICQGQLQTVYSEYPNFIQIRSLPAEL